jgi:hypothetical protein
MTAPQLLSAGLIVAALFASAATAREANAHMRRAVDAYAAAARASATYKHGCVRAPDVGSFATAPYRKPPCEPTTRF